MAHIALQNMTHTRIQLTSMSCSGTIHGLILFEALSNVKNVYGLEQISSYDLAQRR